MLTKTFLLAGMVILSAVSSAQHRISANEALRIAQNRYPGQVIGQPTMHTWQGHRDWGVRVRSGGSVRDVFVNVFSGNIDAANVRSGFVAPRPNRAHVPRGRAVGYWKHHKQGYQEHHQQGNKHAVHPVPEKHTMHPDRDHDKSRPGQPHGHGG